MQLSIAYELVGPDGTRVVFGNSDAARADLDWVGYLDPENGIVGLDGADVRTAAADIIAGDGGIHYDFFHGRRPVAITGQIWPDFPAEDWPVYEDRLQRATNALRADAILRWTNTGGFPKRRLRLRRVQPPRFPGRRPKGFQLALESADYRILGDAVQASAVLDLAEEATLINIGSETATLAFFVNGPAGAPGNPIVLRNLTTGRAIVFKDAFAVAAGQQLVVFTDPPFPVVQVNGVDVYDQVDYLATMAAGGWWGLTPDPAGNDVRVDGAGAGNAQVFWRHAWV